MFCLFSWDSSISRISIRIVLYLNSYLTQRCLEVHIQMSRHTNANFQTHITHKNIHTRIILASVGDIYMYNTSTFPFNLLFR